MARLSVLHEDITVIAYIDAVMAILELLAFYGRNELSERRHSCVLRKTGEESRGNVRAPQCDIEGSP